jgi:hypothetical protein
MEEPNQLAQHSRSVSPLFEQDEPPQRSLVDIGVHHQLMADHEQPQLMVTSVLKALPVHPTSVAEKVNKEKEQSPVLVELDQHGSSRKRKSTAL